MKERLIPESTALSTGLVHGERPENAVFDVPSQVFEDESSWNREIQREFIERQNPALAAKMKKLAAKAKKLQSVTTRRKKSRTRTAS